MPEEDKKVTVGLAIATGLFGLAVVATGYGLLLTWAAPLAVYTCPHCGAEFATEGELLAHIQAEHPEQPSYICPQCGEAFWTEEELQQHIELEHPELPPPAGDFVYTNQQCGLRPFEGAPAWNQPTYSVRITNQAATRGIRTITLHVRSIEHEPGWPPYEHTPWSGSWVETLDPGQSVVRTADQIWPRGTFSPEFSGIPEALGPYYTCYMHITDDVGGSTPECSV